MARLFRKLKGRSLLCAVGLLAITIFLFLQIFSFKVLLGSGGKGRQSGEKIIPPEKRGVQDSLGKSLEDLKKGFEKLVGPRKHKEKYLTQVNLNAQSGVRPSLKHLYVPNLADKFRCLQSKELIDFSKVNDDYCDCVDSTDEPGTAACSHDTQSRFYCSFQVSDTEPLIIFSSRVNDGICDCCDGSDEWGNARVPSELQVKESDKKTYAAVHAPCYDLCDELREGKLLMEKIVAQGRLVKQEYIKFAKDQLNTNEIYGPNGEFMKLTERCHSLSVGEFEYEICPFQSVRQNSFPKSHKILGRSSAWVSRGEEGVWKLKMEDGDKDLCPGGVDRQVLFEFHCGLEDEVVKLSELEKCRYQIIMKTPAAC